MLNSTVPSNEELLVPWAKIKYDYIAGIHQETSLDIDFGINNKRQDCKIGTVSGRQEGE
jgi:hypothetical protein